MSLLIASAETVHHFGSFLGAANYEFSTDSTFYVFSLFLWVCCRTQAGLPNNLADPTIEKNFRSDYTFNLLALEFWCV